MKKNWDISGPKLGFIPLMAINIPIFYVNIPLMAIEEHPFMAFSQKLGFIWTKTGNISVISPRSNCDWMAVKLAIPRLGVIQMYLHNCICMLCINIYIYNIYILI